jgi:hypothetical protein
VDKKYTVKFTATIEVEVEASATGPAEMNEAVRYLGLPALSNGEITACRLAARQLDPDVDWDFEGVREGWDSDV